jgi:hypothetical protein
MNRLAACRLAESCVKEYTRPCGILKRAEGDYTVEPHITDLRVMPESAVAIFFPGGKTLLNATFKGGKAIDGQGRPGYWEIDL